MPNIEWNTLSELRHTLSRAIETMHNMIEANYIDDSVLRLLSALYYHFVDIRDELNRILDEEIENGESKNNL